VKHRTITLIALVLAGGMLAAGTALATTSTKIAFTAKYAGTALTKVTDNVVDISATGTGKGTVIGVGKVSGKGTGDTSQQPCVPFGGTGRMTGIALTTITFRVTTVSKGCGDESGQTFSLVGKAVVLKATGKLKNAKGTLKFTGTFNRGDGSFTVKFFGTLVK